MVLKKNLKELGDLDAIFKWTMWKIYLFTASIDTYVYTDLPFSTISLFYWGTQLVRLTVNISSLQNINVSFFLPERKLSILGSLKSFYDVKLLHQRSNCYYINRSFGPFTSIPKPKYYKFKNNFTYYFNKRGSEIRRHSIKCKFYICLFLFIYLSSSKKRTI